MLCSCGSGKNVDDCLIHFPAPVLILPRHLAEPLRVDRWRHVDKFERTPLDGISHIIHQYEQRFTDVLPNLDDAEHLLIASDYSGSKTNKLAKYELFSFLILPFHAGHAWHAARAKLRTGPLQRRSMSFKGLGDAIKWRALPGFLDAADQIPGILIAAAVSRAHQSLFMRGDPEMNAPDLRPYRHWRRDVFEKLLRITHFLTFFLAGLSRDGQSFVWYSDNDDIAPNRTRLQELGEIWRNVVVSVMPYRVPELKIGTKADDEAGLAITDTLAVPDLACGAWCELLARVGALDFIHARAPVSEALRDASVRTLRILSWFATPNMPLKRLLCIIDEPLPDKQVNYMCSLPPALDHFRHDVEAEIAARSAA